MDNEYNYEAIAKEYAQITPYTIQATPFGPGDSPKDSAIKPLIKLYSVYMQIDRILQVLSNESKQKELYLLATHLSRKIVSNIVTLLNLDSLPDVKNNNPNESYSALVRECLKLSAEGVCSALEYKRQIPYLTHRLCFEEIHLLHTIVLTLTAF